MKTAALSLLVLLTAIPAQAKDEVNLLGMWTTPDDYVLSKVISVVGHSAMISLGYRHGVLEGQRFLILRSENGIFKTVSWVEVTLVKRERSLAKNTTAKGVQAGDLVVIPAKNLDLWHELEPADDEIFRRQYNLKRKNGYDTRIAANKAVDIMREIQALRDKRGEYWKAQISQRPSAAGETYQKKTTAEKIEKANEEGPIGPTARISTEREWFLSVHSTVQTRGWYVIPKTMPDLKHEDRHKFILTTLQEAYAPKSAGY